MLLINDLPFSQCLCGTLILLIVTSLNYAGSDADWDFWIPIPSYELLMSAITQCQCTLTSL